MNILLTNWFSTYFKWTLVKNDIKKTPSLIRQSTLFVTLKVFEALSGFEL